MIPGKDYVGVVVTFLCHDGQGNFLMGKRTHNTRDFHGYWDCGGGKLELGETLEQAIQRELNEEFGCSGEVQESLPAVLHYYPKTESYWLILRYVIKVNREDVKNNEPRSIEEIRWFKLDNLPDKTHPGILEDLKIYGNLLDKYKK